MLQQIEFLFPITIIPQDDEPPVVNMNTVLVMIKGETKQILPAVLSATDMDSESRHLKFTLVYLYSSVEQVLLRQSQTPENFSSWRHSDSNHVLEQVAVEWYLSGILEGTIAMLGPHWHPQLQASLPSELKMTTTLQTNQKGTFSISKFIQLMIWLQNCFLESHYGSQFGSTNWISSTRTCCTSLTSFLLRRTSGIQSSSHLLTKKWPRNKASWVTLFWLTVQIQYLWNLQLQRLGDCSRTSIVQVHTRDGLATAREDYTPVSVSDLWRGTKISGSLKNMFLKFLCLK